MKLKYITDVIEEFAPLSYQDVYDNSGLITGNTDMEVCGALFCVDVTDAVIDEALILGVNLIISHHPLIFTPVKNLCGEGRVERLVVKAVKNDIALYGCHTNLDSTAKGLSYRMAKMLNLKDISVLVPRPDGSGYGAIGLLAEPEDFDVFMSRVKNTFGTQVIKHSAAHVDKIRRVALCSGSGGSVLGDAMRSGADIFITADLKYNHFFEADNRIILADIGHFESEYCSIGILFDIVTKKIPKFAAYKSLCSVNPINYYF